MRTYLCSVAIAFAFGVKFTDATWNEPIKLPGHEHSPTGLKNSRLLALAVQGKGGEIGDWLAVIDKMKYKNMITFFYSSYKDSIDPVQCNNQTVFCITRPHTTWTSGRNQLVQRIAHHEHEHQSHFKYWTFADMDIVHMSTCGENSKCHGVGYLPGSTNLTACCFDGIANMLLSPEVNYPEINYLAYPKQIKFVTDYPTFAHQDCADGALNSYHRHVVPVVFPLIERVDENTWWESQGMHFHISAGCYPGYSVVSNIAGQMQATPDHTSYPRGRSRTLATQAMTEVYGKLGLIPNPMTTYKYQLEQGNCAKLDDTNLFGHWMDDTHEERMKPHPGYDQDGYQKIKTVWKTDAWLNGTNFLKCHKALQPRFVSFIESGDLTSIDGPHFEKIEIKN